MLKLSSVYVYVENIMEIFVKIFYMICVSCLFTKAFVEVHTLCSLKVHEQDTITCS